MLHWEVIEFAAPPFSLRFRLNVLQSSVVAPLLSHSRSDRSGNMSQYRHQYQRQHRPGPLSSYWRNSTGSSVVTSLPPMAPTGSSWVRKSKSFNTYVRPDDSSAPDLLMYSHLTQGKSPSPHRGIKGPDTPCTYSLSEPTSPVSFSLPDHHPPSWSSSTSNTPRPVGPYPRCPFSQYAS